MSDKGHSERNFWGGYNHYDARGNKIGHSERNALGDYVEYDANGKKTGYSSEGFFGGYNHYDEKGRYQGHTDRTPLGDLDHYDSNGKKVGHSNYHGVTGDYSHSSGDGCYVATCVYGSYDCPEVWALRRFRDTVLRKHAAGRLFIRVYYALSPKLVWAFGERRWFRTICRKQLDAFVTYLKKKGIRTTPYKDR